MCSPLQAHVISFLLPIFFVYFSECLNSCQSTKDILQVRRESRNGNPISHLFFDAENRRRKRTFPSVRFYINDVTLGY